MNLTKYPIHDLIDLLHSMSLDISPHLPPPHHPPLHQDIILVQSNMTLSDQKACTKLPKEQGGMSNGCKNKFLNPLEDLPHLTHLPHMNQGKDKGSTRLNFLEHSIHTPIRGRSVHLDSGATI
jgi:hypothetical protein